MFSPTSAPCCSSRQILCCSYSRIRSYWHLGWEAEKKGAKAALVSAGHGGKQTKEEDDRNWGSGGRFNSGRAQMDWW